MNYYNRHLSNILDIFRTFIGHMKISGSGNIKRKAVGYRGPLSQLNNSITFHNFFS